MGSEYAVVFLVVRATKTKNCNDLYLVMADDSR
jgi:hypothetical protein